MSQQYLRIKLVGDNISDLNSFVEEISAICEQLGVNMKGPIPMPTKKLKVTTRRSPCGDGKASFERYQMRIHKRMMDIQINDRVVRMIIKRIGTIPSGLNIELKVI